MSKLDRPSDKNGHDLVNELSMGLKPVRVKSQRALAIQYFITLTALGSACFFALNLGHVRPLKISQIDFLGSLLVFSLNIATGSFLLAQYSRPGVKLSRKGHFLFFSILGVAVILEFLQFIFAIEFNTWGPPLHRGWVCSITALGVGAVAATLLTLELKHEAPVKLKETALFLLLLAGAIAALVLQIHCPNENPIHQALWHILLPIGILAICTRTVSRVALRW